LEKSDIVLRLTITRKNFIKTVVDTWRETLRAISWRGQLLQALTIISIKTHKSASGGSSALVSTSINTFSEVTKTEVICDTALPSPNQDDRVSSTVAENFVEVVVRAWEETFGAICWSGTLISALTIVTIVQDEIASTCDSAFLSTFLEAIEITERFVFWATLDRFTKKCDSFAWLFFLSTYEVVHVIVGAIDKTFRAAGTSSLFPKTLTIIRVKNEEIAAWSLRARNSTTIDSFFKIEAKLFVLTAAFLSLVEESKVDISGEFFKNFFFFVGNLAFCISSCLLFRSSCSVLVEIIPFTYFQSFGACRSSLSILNSTFTIIRVKQEEHAIELLDTHIRAISQIISIPNLGIIRSTLLTFCKKGDFGSIYCHGRVFSFNSIKVVVIAAWKSFGALNRFCFFLSALTIIRIIEEELTSWVVEAGCSTLTQRGEIPEWEVSWIARGIFSDQINSFGHTIISWNWWRSGTTVISTLTIVILIKVIVGAWLESFRALRWRCVYRHALTIVRVEMEEKASFSECTRNAAVFCSLGSLERKLIWLCHACFSFSDQERFPFVRKLIIELRIGHHDVQPLFLANLIILVDIKPIKQWPVIQVLNGRFRCILKASTLLKTLPDLPEIVRIAVIVVLREPFHLLPETHLTKSRLAKVLERGIPHSFREVVLEEIIGAKQGWGGNF
jgi:hypothetical protein